MASVLAAASIPARAIGWTAAAANSRVWIAIPVGAIATIGWMAGTIWLTLPMSDEPIRSRIGSPSFIPTVVMLAAKRSRRGWFRLSGSYTVSCLGAGGGGPPAPAGAPAPPATRLVSGPNLAMGGGWENGL